MQKLWDAAFAGNLIAVQEAIEEGADVDFAAGASPCPCTPLVVAAQRGDTEIVKALIDAGADLDAARAKNAVTALFMAAQEGHVLVVEALVRAGAYVNEPSDTKSTPLMVASENGHSTIVETLLLAGADPTLENNAGVTALHFSSFFLGDSSVDIVNALLDAGATIDAQDSLGDTPLMWAAWFANLNVAQALIHRGADLSLENNAGDTALAQVCGCVGAVAFDVDAGCPEGGCDTQMVVNDLTAALSIDEVSVRPYCKMQIISVITVLMVAMQYQAFAILWTPKSNVCCLFLADMP